MQHGRFIKSLAAKPFVILTGNSGTGKTKLAELFAHWLCGKDSMNYAIVAVGADWSDNRHVLGFINQFLKSGGDAGSLPVYQATPILELILRAVDDSSNPYFLILDEMNLSHVERYFADFLSAMESKSASLAIHNIGGGETKLPTEAGGTPKVPGRVRLPDNLFVVGTVNVDETTYTFSPKVLDRANVLEFRTGLDGLDRFFATGGNGLGDIAQADQMMGKAFLDLSRKARGGALPEIPALEQVQNALKEVFQILELAGLEFGFRTVNEILRYHRVSYALAETPEEWTWEPVFDQQVMQKILPRLVGNQKKLGEVLDKLREFCENTLLGDGDKERLETNGAMIPGDRNLAHVKILQMQRRLENERFTGYF